MEKLIYDNWILQAYFSENYYPKEIVQLIILLEINLHQLDINCSSSHCFFSHDDKIYFHTATKKADIEAAKLLLMYLENENLKLNCTDWLVNLKKIIVYTEDCNLCWIYASDKTIQKLLLILDWHLVNMLFFYSIRCLKKDLNVILKTLALHNYTVIFAKCENNLLYPIDILFPTFHIHMEKILK